ncbi:MAG: ABC transporter ATP-binding protein [Bacilli bacterium]|nr:ABC transporter ATP-binding protein [Bacilli bacterium]
MADIVIKGLTKVYNKGQQNEVYALHGIDFEVKSGEFIVILGASGAGKTTLLNILGGMDNASSGQYLLGEEDVAKFNDKKLQELRRNRIGFIFQFYNLMPNLTALENVQLSASVAPNPFDAKKTLTDVGLEGRLDNFPSQLSGGEQQRVAIARALVKNPDLLLCDEPTGALDSKTGASILTLLLEVAEKYNKTVLVVTHNAKIAEVAKRVVRIADGKIVEDVYQDSPKKVSEISW